MSECFACGNSIRDAYLLEGRVSPPPTSPPPPSTTHNHTDGIAPLLVISTSSPSSSSSSLPLLSPQHSNKTNSSNHNQNDNTKIFTTQSVEKQSLEWVWHEECLSCAHCGRGWTSSAPLASGEREGTEMEVLQFGNEEEEGRKWFLPAHHPHPHPHPSPHRYVYCESHRYGNIQMKWCNSCGIPLRQNEFAIVLDMGILYRHIGNVDFVDDGHDTRSGATGTSTILYYHTHCFSCVVCGRILQAAHGDQFGLKWGSLSQSSSASTWAGADEAKNGAVRQAGDIHKGLIYCADHYHAHGQRDQSTRRETTPATAHYCPSEPSGPVIVSRVSSQSGEGENRSSKEAIKLDINNNTNNQNDNSDDDSDRIPTSTTPSTVTVNIFDNKSVKKNNKRITTRRPQNGYITRRSFSNLSSRSSSSTLSALGVQHGGRSKRIRTSFTSGQIRRLRDYFADNRNPDNEELLRIIAETGLGKRVVQVWFQNARAKLRKSIANGHTRGPHLVTEGIQLTTSTTTTDDQHSYVDEHDEDRTGGGMLITPLPSLSTSFSLSFGISTSPPIPPTPPSPLLMTCESVERSTMPKRQRTRKGKTQSKPVAQDIYCEPNTAVLTILEEMNK